MTQAFRKKRSYTQIRNEFVIRFYRWAVADTLRQLKQGFPRLKKMKSGPAMKYLEYISALPENDRRKFVIAGLKLAHPKAARVLKHSMSPHEQSLLNSFHRGQEVQMPNSPIRAYISSQSEMAMNDLKVSNPGSFTIDKVRLISKIADKISSPLGQPIHPVNRPQLLQFRSQVGNFSVLTTVETPRVFQLRYFQAIGLVGRAKLIERTSALDWMGVKMETYWNYLTESDIDSTIDSLAEMCCVLLDAIPSLGKGLRITN